MAMSAQEIEELIRAGLPGAQVAIEDFPILIAQEGVLAYGSGKNSLV